jgi:hypothetical protein
MVAEKNVGKGESFSSEKERLLVGKVVIFD